MVGWAVEASDRRCAADRADQARDRRRRPTRVGRADREAERVADVVLAEEVGSLRDAAKRLRSALPSGRSGTTGTCSRPSRSRTTSPSRRTAARPESPVRRPSAAPVRTARSAACAPRGTPAPATSAASSSASRTTRGRGRKRRNASERRAMNICSGLDVATPVPACRVLLGAAVALAASRPGVGLEEDGRRHLR